MLHVCFSSFLFAFFVFSGSFFPPSLRLFFSKSGAAYAYLCYRLPAKALLLLPWRHLIPFLFSTIPLQVKLKSFVKFEDTTQALAAAMALTEGTMDKSLKKFLQENVVSKDVQEELAVSEAKVRA